MADRDTGTNRDEFDRDVQGRTAQPDFDHLTGIVTDGIIGALGGLVGTAAMSVGLFVAAALGVFDTAAFGTLSDLTGLGVVFPGQAVTVGYLIFVAGGMVIWPLLFVSTAGYLPGETFATKGLSFGFVLWTGFVLAFVGDVGVGRGAITIALYAVTTLLSHFAYGFTLGAVFDYLSNRPETLV
ncbi:DUF6789 family protein [Halorientalis halophila]|uniref:DUF6789 family protein n=1 Tax=Halorientalis halophila TaxID=3108499 RepID=UPI0030095E26